MIKAIDYWCNCLMFPGAAQRVFEWEDVVEALERFNRVDLIKEFSPEEFVTMLDDAGVEKVLLPAVQIWDYKTRKMGWYYSVEEIADVVSKHPDRFGGLYGINPYQKMEGVRQLEKAVKECGFVGAHLHVYGYERPINHRDLYPFYAKCVELDVPVVMQVGHSAESMPSAMARPILIDDVALYFPELRIVAAHTGWPWTEELIAMATKHPNVYIGTSAYAPKYWDKSLVRFINSQGRGKALFGTDYPLVTHHEALEQIDALGLSEKAKEQFLRETPLKVFKL